MALPDHGNFDGAVEVTKELLTAAMLAQVQIGPVPNDLVETPQWTFRPDVTASMAGVECQLQSPPVLVVKGRISGSLIIEAVKEPGVVLPKDADLRSIAIMATFDVVTSPRVGTVRGQRGLIAPLASAAVTLTLDVRSVMASFPVQALLVRSYLFQGEAGYQNAAKQIMEELRTSIASHVTELVGRRGNLLIIPEPANVTFGGVVTTGNSLRLLLTVDPPDGDLSQVGGMTVRRDSLGGPLDHAALVLSNGYVLRSLVFPAATSALGLSGVVSHPDHPCLLAEPILIHVGVPLLAAGLPPPLLYLDWLLAQIDDSQIHVEVEVRAEAVGMFTTVRMRGSLSARVNAFVGGETLTVSLGTPVVRTATEISIDPMVYVSVFLTGGATLAALTAFLDAFTDAFGSPFLDAILRSLMGALISAQLPRVELPLAGVFAALGLSDGRTTESGGPPRFGSVRGSTVLLDRVNDVVVRFA